MVGHHISNHGNICIKRFQTFEVLHNTKLLTCIASGERQNCLNLERKLRHNIIILQNIANKKEETCHKIFRKNVHQMASGMTSTKSKLKCMD